MPSPCGRLPAKLRTMVIRPGTTAAAGAALVLILVAACTDSSGGNGSQAGGGSSSTSATPSGSTSGSKTTASAPPAPSASSTPAISGTAAPAPPSTTPIPPVMTSAVPSGNSILGPTGWQTLQLRMAPAVAEATGIFISTSAPSGGTCASWFAVGAAAIDSATISPNLGVIAITIASTGKMLMTPEGMELGWTVAQVHAAYPSFPLDAESIPSGPPTIPVPQNDKAVYRTRLTAGVVVTMTLESRPQDCYS